MPRIAISYRRADSAQIAGRILDRLAIEYGKDAIFMDIYDVPLGADFPEHVQKVWSQTEILLVLIGPKWLGQGQDGHARIHDRDDPVRTEVETGLKKGVPLIPVLLDGARMPARSELPKSIGKFVYRAAAQVDSGPDFDSQITRLIAGIDQVLGNSGRSPKPVAPKTVSMKLDAGPEQVDVIPQGSGRQPDHWLTLSLRYVAFPGFLLLVAHYLIVNALDLDAVYLRIVAFILPFPFGAVFFWQTRTPALTAFAVGAIVGLLADAAMTVSAGLSYGQPILPSTTLEWRENVEYVVGIALSFFAGNVFARLLGVSAWKKLNK
jgi:hypothetical protein